MLCRESDPDPDFYLNANPDPDPVFVDEGADILKDLFPTKYYGNLAHSQILLTCFSAEANPFSSWYQEVPCSLLQLEP
jgi:hypothetical protein